MGLEQTNPWAGAGAVCGQEPRRQLSRHPIEDLVPGGQVVMRARPSSLLRSLRLSSSLSSLLISPRLRDSAHQVHMHLCTHTNAHMCTHMQAQGSLQFLVRPLVQVGSDHKASLIPWLPAPKAHGLAWPGLRAPGRQGSCRPPLVAPCARSPPPPHFFPSPCPVLPSPPPPPWQGCHRAAPMGQGQVAPCCWVSLRGVFALRLEQRL